jgi:hypothetical protein
MNKETTPSESSFFMFGLALLAMANRSPENHPSRVIPAQAGIQLLPDMDPRFRGGDVLTFISLGGLRAHDHSVVRDSLHGLRIPGPSDRDFRCATGHPVLSNLIQRETVYRLLRGPQGERLRAIATLGDQSQRTAKAIAWLKANYAKPLRLGDLAEVAHMGVSTLHHHFRALTAMSPLQYQIRGRIPSPKSGLREGTHVCYRMKLSFPIPEPRRVKDGRHQDYGYPPWGEAGYVPWPTV